MNANDKTLRSVWQSVCLAGGLLLVVRLAAGADAAPVTLASSAMGPPNQSAGLAISATNFVGWRFQVASPLAVTEVGGHLGITSGNLFAAIVSLAGIDALPEGAPFTEGKVIKSKTFTAPSLSTDFRTPLAATLAPGAYALVFGAGQFSATGTGLIPNVQQPNIAPTTQATYIAWRQTLPGVFKWTAGSLNNLRFVIVGTEIAGPTDFNLDGKVDQLDLLVWKAGYGGNAPAGGASGDADRDGDVDGADVLAWQRSVTATSAATASVAEPTSALLTTLAVGWLLLAGGKRPFAGAADG